MTQNNSLTGIKNNGTYITYPIAAAPVTITSGVGVWTKGSYTEVIPANTITTDFYLTAAIYSVSLGNNEYELDIATGAALSEVIIATINLQIFASTMKDGLYEYIFTIPLYIPPNTRLSCRCSDVTGSNTLLTKLKIYK